MTERAAEFYTAEAQRLDVVAPSIFNTPIPLLDKGQRLSVLVSGAVGEQVVGRVNVVLESVVPYVMAGSNVSRIYYDQAVLARSKLSVGAASGAMLLVHTVKAGQISDLAIEAIAPDELVLPGMLSAFGPSKNYPGLRDPEARRAFFIVSGLLKPGPYSFEPCAGIAGVYVNTTNHSKVPTPRFVTGALSLKIARQWYNTQRKDLHSKPRLLQ